MNTGTRRDVIDVLVLGDLNADLTLTGADLVPLFGQVETLVDDAGLVLGSSGGIFASGERTMRARSPRMLMSSTFGKASTRP